MLNLVYLKNPDSFEIYKAAVNDNKFETWKVAEIKRFPPLQTFFTVIS